MAKMPEEITIKVKVEMDTIGILSEVRYRANTLTIVCAKAAEHGLDPDVFAQLAGDANVEFGDRESWNKLMERLSIQIEKEAEDATT